MVKPEVMELITYGFYGLISIVATLVLKVLTSMKESIDQLNIQVAVILAKTASHEKELEKQDKRIERLEFLNQKKGG